MNDVSLVCTVHDEMGQANASELRTILARIQPKVIFLEVPAASFDDYFQTCIRYNLESLAVRRYRKDYQVKLVPVDLPTPKREFFEDYAQLHLIVRGESAEYRQLIAMDAAHTRTHGFAYLNSEYCDKHWLDVYKEMLGVIKKLGDSHLMEIYQSWTGKLDARESAMMGGILKYCIDNEFERGAFLVGSAHRRRLIEIAREQTIGDARIGWDWKFEP